MIRRVVSHEWVREGFSAVVVELTPIQAVCKIFVTVQGASSLTTPHLVAFSVSRFPDKLWELAVDAVEMRSRTETVGLQLPPGYSFVKVDLVGRLAPPNTDSAFATVGLPALKHEVKISVDTQRPAAVAADALVLSPITTSSSPRRLSPRREVVHRQDKNTRRPRTLVSDLVTTSEAASPPRPPDGSPSPPSFPKKAHDAQSPSFKEVDASVGAITGFDGLPLGIAEPAAAVKSSTTVSIMMDADDVQAAYGPSYQLLGLRREVVEKQAKLKELLDTEEQEKELISCGKVKASLWSQEKSMLLANLRPNLKTPVCPLEGSATNH